MNPSRKPQQFGNFARLIVMSCLLLVVCAAPLRAGTVTPIPVTRCGVLNKPFGVYLVANDITTSGTGNCISISGASASLNFQNHSLTGSGAGKGVRVLAGTTGVLVENGTISGFASGIYADGGANKLVISFMNATGNTDGLVVNNSNNITVNLSSFDSNLNTGASLLSCKGGNFAASDLSGNSTGVYLYLSSGFNFQFNGIGGGSAGANLKTGAYLNQSDNNTFMGNGFIASQGYGVWLVRSDNNRFDVNGASGYLAGIFVGCSSTGPGGASCSPSGSMNNTFLLSGGSATNGPGVAIDQGNTSNRVIDNGAEGATLFDGNANCDSNIWSLNTFSSANQPCIN